MVPWWLLGLLVFFLITGVYYYLIFPRQKGAPYQPTSQKKIATMVSFAQHYRCRHALDLGSGDGRIVLALQNQDIPAEGIELNPLLVWWSKRKLALRGLSPHAIHRGDFWKHSLQPYDCIVLFQYHTIAPRLTEKFLKELSPRAVIISHYWELPGLKKLDQKGNVYVYRARDLKTSFASSPHG